MKKVLITFLTFSALTISSAATAPNLFKVQWMGQVVNSDVGIYKLEDKDTKCYIAGTYMGAGGSDGAVSISCVKK